MSVTMSSAARSAGVSVGLVQHYYDSKEALLVDTLDRVLADILGRVEHATARAESRNARRWSILIIARPQQDTPASGLRGSPRIVVKPSKRLGFIGHGNTRRDSPRS